jgi:predicted transposase YbfD/YdcC
MTRPSLALIEVFSAIPDFRQARGKRHPLRAILALAAAAMLCGYRSYSAIAEWGRYYGADLAAALGFTHQKTPCASTLHTIFRNLDRQMFESRLADWAEAVFAHASGDPLEATAIDGKSLRGSLKQGAPAAHLLSAVSHRLGLTLGQSGVPDQTNEIGVVIDLVSRLILEGRVITVDALLTQKKLAEAIIAKRGHYLMAVKDNQPELLNWVSSVLEAPQWFCQGASEAESLDLGHGRIEHRKLVASSALADSPLWPGIQQVMKIERVVITKKSNAQREEVAYAVTSLSREQASAAELLKMVRGHWQIENRSHWVRDVTFDEDRSQVRKGSIPQVMAALRNTVIGLIRSSGENQIAAACRRFAARPWTALALMGIKPEN